MTDIRAQEHEFKPFVQQAVAPHLHYFSKLKYGAVVSSEEEDTRLSFDMRVGMWLPVSVRLRAHNFFERYRDFSIRSRTRCSGQTRQDGEVVKCEIDKLRDGHGNCYFYGWLNPDASEIAHYLLIDINRFRPFLSRGQEKPNGDGTYARYYSRRLLQDAGAIVFQSWDDDEYPIYPYGLKINARTR